MQILLANAKIMRETADMQPATLPAFQERARTLAREMGRMDIDMLARAFHCNRMIAAENACRYANFEAAPPLPALWAYNGQAYKHLRAETLSEGAVEFAQRHLWITCFLYGLLRPLDAIVPYRMEPGIRLDATDDRPVGSAWKELLTDFLIASVKADDGVLVHLSTAEYEQLFDWRRVQREVHVVQPLFYVRRPDGSLKMQAVWAKSCRGAMTRFILEERIDRPEGLTAFAYEGFRLAPGQDDDHTLCFVRDDVP